MDQVLEELKTNAQFQRRIIPASEGGPSQDEVILTPRRSEPDPPSEYATPTGELGTSGEEQAVIEQTPTSAEQQAGKPDGPIEIELKLAAAPPASPFDKVRTQSSTCWLHSHKLVARAQDRHVGGKSRQPAAGGPPTLSKMTWSHDCLQTATEQAATEQQPAPEGQQFQGSGGVNASRRSTADAVRKGYSSSPQDFASSTEGHLIMPPAKMHVQPAVPPSAAAEPSLPVSRDESVVAAEEPLAAYSLVATSAASGIEKPEEEPARVIAAGLARQSRQLPSAVLADLSTVGAQRPAQEAGAQEERSLQRCLESQLDGLQTTPGKLTHLLSDCQSAPLGPGNTFSGIPGNTLTALASLSAQAKQRQAL